MPETITPHIDTPLAVSPRKGAIGEKNGRAKLTAAIVIRARACHKQLGTSFAALARQFGVSRFVMRSAILGLTWKDINPADVCD